MVLRRKESLLLLLVLLVDWTLSHIWSASGPTFSLGRCTKTCETWALHSLIPLHNGTKHVGKPHMWNMLHKANSSLFPAKDKGWASTLRMLRDTR